LRGVSYGEVAAEAVATVACVLLLAGSFRTNAMPAAAGEVEKCWVLHLDFCLRARTAFLAGYDRSILGGVGVESGEKRRRERVMPRLAQLSSLSSWP
jgi:hypothetical protein